MPTAAKLVASMSMAFWGVIVIMVVIQVYPDLDKEANGMTIAAAVVGLFVGWRSMGPRAQLGHDSFIIAGLKGGVAAIFWALLIFAITYMIRGIMEHAYYQPMTAVLQIPRSMIAYGFAAADPKILGTLFGLSIVSSFLARRAHIKWG